MPKGTLSDGEVLEFQEHPLPPPHRAAAIGWSVTSDPHKTSLKFRSLVAYNSHGVVVGHGK